MGRKEDRDKRLDALDKAVKEWAEKEKKRLEGDVTFLKSVVKGRTGAGQLSNQGVSDSKDLLAGSIREFLEG